MVYLLYGTKDYRIDEEIKKITKNIDKINITKYDLNVDEIKDAINDAETYSLFQEKKIIIIENANMFTGSTTKDSDIIEKYIENQNLATTLILTVRGEKIDSRKKITKLIQKKGKIIELNEDINIDNLIKKELKDYKIDFQTLSLFKDRVGTNPLIIENEINKIKLYKDNKEITKEDILNVTCKTIEIDIFKLIDNIVKGNKEKGIEIYHEMLKINEEPLKIVIMLANQFRIMYQSKELMMKGYTEKDIASLLKIHPYRVKLALQNSRNYSSKTLLKYLNELADIDIGIKTGKINKDLALELFILK